MVDRKLWCRRGRSVTEHDAAIACRAYPEGTGKGERGVRRCVTGAIRRCHGFPVNFRSAIYVEASLSSSCSSAARLDTGMAFTLRSIRLTRPERTLPGP